MGINIENMRNVYELIDKGYYYVQSDYLEVRKKDGTGRYPNPTEYYWDVVNWGERHLDGKFGIAFTGVLGTIGVFELEKDSFTFAMRWL